MSDSGDQLVFMMGEFTAHFPTDRCYAKNHMWLQRVGDSSVFRCGLTAYAVRLLQDVYFLDWDVEPSTPVALRQAIGSIESKKAESDLFAPIAGTLSEINALALEDPGVINIDPYGEGWLIELTTDSAEVLSPEEYLQHLEEAWPLAQRTIKGQIQ